jgi:hypothetical protein
MTNRLFLALACVLLAVRLPSLVQPMGADQGLYAYVGERILDGGLPYRDAWDQKPPAIHLTYAVMRGLWPHPSAVPAADLLMAAVAAMLLWRFGASVVSPAVGQWAALLFLLLSNPSFARLGGVSVRAQCETFIAAAVTGAFLLLAGSRDRPATWRFAAAGALFGLVFAFKYNAVVYAAAGVFALFLWKRVSVRALVALCIGFLVPIAAFIVWFAGGAWFAGGGALRDAYEATIAYNLRYSGETYAGPVHAATYLLTFPVRHARVDALWLIGGGGCAVLLVAARHARERLTVVAWVAAACLSIAINGSRDLPQYFVQAGPPLALAGAWAGSLLWTRRRMINAAAILVVAVAVWRVNDFPKLVANTWHDGRYAAGRTTLDEHLARYGDRATRKYSALAMAQLAAFLREHSNPRDRVYVFGFSCAAYVEADRVSASRFFWSRPVIAGFNEGQPGYGVGGLLDDLRLHAPAVVALQQRDWFPDVDDSAHFFMTSLPLAGWLRASYERVDAVEGFDVWVKRGDAQ